VADATTSVDILPPGDVSEDQNSHLLWGEPGMTHNLDKPPPAYVNKVEDSFNQ
jgi:hypothetical protein